MKLLLLLSSTYTTSRPFLFLTEPCSLGVCKKLGEDTAMTADPSDQRDVPYIWHHAQCKNPGKRREGGDSDILCLSFQETILYHETLLSCKCQKLCLLTGIDELIPYFLFAYACSFCFIVFLFPVSFQIFCYSSGLWGVRTIF